MCKARIRDRDGGHVYVRVHAHVRVRGIVHLHGHGNVRGHGFVHVHARVNGCVQRRSMNECQHTHLCTKEGAADRFLCCIEGGRGAHVIRPSCMQTCRRPVTVPTPLLLAYE